MQNSAGNVASCAIVRKSTSRASPESSTAASDSASHAVCTTLANTALAAENGALPAASGGDPCGSKQRDASASSSSGSAKRGREDALWGGESYRNSLGESPSSAAAGEAAEVRSMRLS